MHKLFYTSQLHNYVYTIFDAWYIHTHALHMKSVQEGTDQSAHSESGRWSCQRVSSLQSNLTQNPVMMPLAASCDFRSRGVARVGENDVIKINVIKTDTDRCDQDQWDQDQCLQIWSRPVQSDMIKTDVIKTDVIKTDIDRYDQDRCDQDHYRSMWSRETDQERSDQDHYRPMWSRQIWSRPM